MYSLDFATQVSRLCMDEVRKRGLKERKILRKSEPNSVLLLKVFRKQNCTADDLTCVSIHSVATLMQDTLWCCQERIVPKKVWRVINYETCTLDELSRFITKKGESLLIEILDFLVQVMRYKSSNQMDAYHLGESMGKVTLGPADCDPIIAEKAGHFLTRMIIEHSKMICGGGTVSNSNNRVDSGFISDSNPNCNWTFNSGPQHLYNKEPMSKSEAAKAKAKSYNRLIKKVHKRNQDWETVANFALYAMLEDKYERETINENHEPYLSIFSTHLDPSQAIQSPVLFRLVTEASKAVEPIPKDPFANSYLFNNTRQQIRAVEKQITVAFDDFLPLIQSTKSVAYYEAMNEKGLGPNHNNNKYHQHMNIINSSISHMKLNMRKNKSENKHYNSDFSEEHHKAIPGVAATVNGTHNNDNDNAIVSPVLTGGTTNLPLLSPTHRGSVATTNTTSTTQASFENESHTTNSSNKTLYSNNTEDVLSKLHAASAPIHKQSKHNQVKSMMKRVIKIGAMTPSKKTAQASIF